MADLSLPASYRWGYVVGRVVEAIADTAADTDDKPEIRVPVGAVVFTPTETLRKTLDYPAFVVSRSVRASIGADGRIIDAEGRPGIWLVTGIYRVSFSIDAGTIPDFLVEVAESHTTTAPLDLVTAAPPTIPTGTSVQTLVVPAGGTSGQVLTRSDSGLRASARSGMSSCRPRTRVTPVRACWAAPATCGSTARRHPRPDSAAIGHGSPPTHGRPAEPADRRAFFFSERNSHGFSAVCRSAVRRRPALRCTCPGVSGLAYPRTGARPH